MRKELEETVLLVYGSLKYKFLPERTENEGTSYMVRTP